MTADTYAEIRDDLDSLMGDIQSASMLVTFIVMRETQGPDAPDLSPDFRGALWSVQNLLDALSNRGDAMVSRMMVLEQSTEAASAGKAVRS